MGKKGFDLIHYDFDTGIFQVIPASHESYKICDSCAKNVLSKSQGAVKGQFKSILLKSLIPKIEKTHFPTKNDVFVFIVQYFASGKDYASQDLDNMAKTILDVLKGQFYVNDRQVRVLLMLKKMTDARVPQNFAYIAVKELKDNKDFEIIRAAGIERSVTYYHDMLRTA